MWRRFVDANRRLETAHIESRTIPESGKELPMPEEKIPACFRSLPE